MLLAALFTVLSATTTVSLTLDAELKCPTQASLSDRLGRVGMSVLGPKAPVPERLTASFEVSVKPTPEGLLLQARRTSDGKVFERTLDPGKEDCATVERLVAVLIHSWITSKMPVLSPSSAPDAGKR